jgi:hypothetical protein
MHTIGHTCICLADALRNMHIAVMTSAEYNSTIIIALAQNNAINFVTTF